MPGEQLRLPECQEQRSARTACGHSVSKVFGGLIVAPLVVGLACERLRLLAVLTERQDRQHKAESHGSKLSAISSQPSALSEN
jgi:hypothetical protein